MTREQIKNWVVDYIKKNPKPAKEYKEQLLASWNAELKLRERQFNDESGLFYRNEAFSKEIISIRKKIERVEKETAEEVLVDDFVDSYDDRMKDDESLIKLVKSFNDEDHYTKGVFQDTEYDGIRCKEDFERVANGKYKVAKKIKKIYQKGLSKRNEYIEKGKKSHRELLEEKEQDLKQYSDIDKNGPEVIKFKIANKARGKKYYCRELAKMSVADAFNQMGAHPTQIQAKQIDIIVEMHDPKVVESAIQALTEKPTKNMLALAKNISETQLSREEIHSGKGLGLGTTVMGAILTAVGAVGISSAVGASDPIDIIGGAAISVISTGFGVGLAAMGLKTLTRTSEANEHLAKQDELMYDCIEDLLNEVVFQETYSKDLEH